MKTEEELKEWFWDIYNSCYMVKNDAYPNTDFFYYDQNFIRQCKLKTILGEEIIYPTKPKGECLFAQDLKMEKLWMDWETVWSVLEKELGYNFLKTKNLITGWLDEHDKPMIPLTTNLTWMNTINQIFGDEN